MENKTRNELPVVVGIGEVLWDMLPEKTLPGGAPANVVFHCSQLGANSYLVSKLGYDDLGDEMEELLTNLGFKPDFLNVRADKPTGTVSVWLDAGKNPQYKIQKNVAWDHIRWSPPLEDLARKVDAVCFGSLAQRGPVSRETIGRFLDCTSPSCLRVLDINLRKPYPDSAVLLASLEKANVLKLNTEELDYLSNLFALKSNTQNRLMLMIEMFNLSCIALTRGAQGSILVTGDETVECPGLKTDVQDTVGAGDAFTAAMTIGLLRKMPLHEINLIAGQIARCVCAQAGAMVSLPFDVVRNLRDFKIPVREYRKQQTGPNKGTSLPHRIIDRPGKRR